VADRSLTAWARELREQAGVSQRAMAAHVGVAPSVLAAWEDGRIIVPGLTRPEAARRWYATLRLLDATSSPAKSGNRGLPARRRGRDQPFYLAGRYGPGQAQPRRRDHENT
jgi:transcriptional regulator with XRE-family HTH domain